MHVTEQDKLKAIEYHVNNIMNILDIPLTDSVVGTPQRIAKMYLNEIFSSLKPEALEELNSKMKLFDNEKKGDDLIVVKDIPFYSTCEHHFMPFFGKVAIGYVPNEKILGLSKFPRIVKHFSKLPQLQERLTKDIAEYVMNITGAKIVIVKIYDTTHTCCTARGIESEGTTNTIQTFIGDDFEISTQDVWKVRDDFNREVR